MATQSLAQQVSKRLSYITMMEGCGFPKGSQKHAGMVRETVDGVLSFLKQVKDISVDSGMEIHEVLKERLEQDNIGEVAIAVFGVKLISGSPDSQTKCEINACNRARQNVDAERAAPSTPTSLSPSNSDAAWRR